MRIYGTMLAQQNAVQPESLTRHCRFVSPAGCAWCYPCIGYLYSHSQFCSPLQFLLSGHLNMSLYLCFEVYLFFLVPQHTVCIYQWRFSFYFRGNLHICEEDSCLFLLIREDAHILCLVCRLCFTDHQYDICATWSPLSGHKLLGEVKKGEWRLIINLKPLNALVVMPSMKMEMIQSVRNLLQIGDMPTYIFLFTGCFENTCASISIAEHTNFVCCHSDERQVPTFLPG